MKVFQTRAPRLVNKSLQKGVGMVEIALGLVIGAIILVGVVNYFSTNSTAAQANQLGSDMSMLIGKVKSSYSGQYANVTNARLNTGGFFARTTALTNVAGVVTHSVGGGTLTAAPGTVTVANDSVKYTLTGIQDAACLPLVTSLARTATTLTVAGNIVKAAGGQPVPENITCANDSNTIVIQVI